MPRLLGVIEDGTTGLSGRAAHAITLLVRMSVTGAGDGSVRSRKNAHSLCSLDMSLCGSRAWCATCRASSPSVQIAAPQAPLAFLVQRPVPPLLRRPTP
jgi:hypothetical protein